MARRARDYAAERARAWARAEALGLSRSAALGKPRKGEQTKRAAGLDARTRAGMAAAQARALQRGTSMPPDRRTVRKAATRAGTVRSSTNPRLLTSRVLNQLNSGRRVNVVIETTDPVTGARRLIEPWRKGGINAQVLREMLRDSDDSWSDCVTNAGAVGQAGTTDIDALSEGDEAIVALTLTYH